MHSSRSFYIILVGAHVNECCFPVYRRLPHCAIKRRSSRRWRRCFQTSTRIDKTGASSLHRVAREFRSPNFSVTYGAYNVCTVSSVFLKCTASLLTCTYPLDMLPGRFGFTYCSPPTRNLQRNLHVLRYSSACSWAKQPAGCQKMCAECLVPR